MPKKYMQLYVDKSVQPNSLWYSESEVAELKEEIIRIKNIADSNFKSSEWNSDKWRELRDENEKLQKEIKRLTDICKLNENQKKENVEKMMNLQKENTELHNIILQKDNEWEEKIDKLFDTMKDRSQNKWADDQIINFFKINLKRN